MSDVNDFTLDDDLRAFVEERLGTPFNQDEPDDTPVEPSEEPDEPPEPDTEEPADEPTEPTEPDSEPSGVTLPDGTVLTNEEALSYAQFDALLRNDPELFRVITETIQGRAASAPGAQAQAPPRAPALPEFTDDDLTDPAVRSLYETARQQREYIEQMDARLNQVRDITIQQQHEELAALIDSKSGEFATKHNLTRDEMARVRGTAERLNVIPSLMRGIDPITGKPSPRDRGTAISRAYDIAYNFIPEFHDRAIAEAVKDRAKSTKRKQRLAGIGGSSGGVPKNEPVPTTDQGRREAMIREVAEAMGDHRPE